MWYGIPGAGRQTGNGLFGGNRYCWRYPTGCNASRRNNGRDSITWKTSTWGPLRRAAARSLIHRFVGEDRIPARVISDIISRCDGIPLFLEELTRTALQAQRPATGTPQAIRGEPEIPGKIWAVLLARLDRQHQASREAAQIGAVLGREFSYSLLAEIWPHNRDMLDRALHSLCKVGRAVKKREYGKYLLHVQVGIDAGSGVPEHAKASPAKSLQTDHGSSRAIHSGTEYSSHTGEKQ